MLDAVSKLLADDPRVAYAVVFGSAARAQPGPHSDLDITLGLAPGSTLGALEMGALAARLEEAAGRPVDLVLLDEAPPALAYRVFRDGQAVAVRDPSAPAARWRRRAVVDSAVLAEKIASVRDAVARIREVLPPSSDALLADRARLPL